MAMCPYGYVWGFRDVQMVFWRWPHFPGTLIQDSNVPKQHLGMKWLLHYLMKFVFQCEMVGFHGFSWFFHGFSWFLFIGPWLSSSGFHGEAELLVNEISHLHQESAGPRGSWGPTGGVWFWWYQNRFTLLGSNGIEWDIWKWDFHGI